MHQSGHVRGKVVLSNAHTCERCRKERSVGAVRTATDTHPGTDHSKIPVTLAAAPPDQFPATVGNGLRGQGNIVRCVPLCEKRFPVVFRAEAEQGLSNV